MRVFIDNAFNLGRIIKEKIGIGISLVFSPPKIYEVENAMEAQAEYRQGLNQQENSGNLSFSQAIKKVKKDAQSFLERSHTAKAISVECLDKPINE